MGTREHPAARLREEIARVHALQDENDRLRAENEDLRETARELAQDTADLRGVILELRMQLAER